MATLRITPPAPPATGPDEWQRCFEFVPAVVVVHARWRCPPAAVAPCARHLNVRTPAGQLPLSARPRAPRRRPRRSPALRPFAPRSSIPGDRPRSMGVRGLTEWEFAEMERDVAELERAGVYAARPVTFGECEPGPCAWLSCRHHLKLEIDPVTHSVKDNFPGVDFDEMPETCSLRVADLVSAGETMPLPEVGRYLNITMEWVRKLQDGAMEVVKRRLDTIRRRRDDEDE